MNVTSEQLFMHPLAFGVATASPVQRAILRAADGLPLGALAKHPDVVAAFGGREAVEALPTSPPTELFVVAGVRCGKSLIAACIATRIALTADLRLVDPSEIACVPIVSVKMKNARIIMQHCMRAFGRKGGNLVRYLATKPKPNSEELTIRRDDGRLVEIAIAAGSKAGSNLVSKWVISVIFDEAARQQGQEDGIINFEDQRESVITRLDLIDGQLLAITSPWAARGPVYEICRNYKGPTGGLVLARSTGPRMCPSNWPAEKIEKMKNDPSREGSYTTDCLGLFADVEGGWLLESDLDKSLCDRTEETLARSPNAYYVAAQDAGLRGNSWSLVILGVVTSDDGDDSKTRYFVARTWQATGSRKDPLNVEATLLTIKNELREYGLTEVWTDSFGAEFIIQSGDALGVTVREDDDTTAEKDQRHVNLKSTMLAGRFEGTTDPRWRSDMLAASIKRTPNGQKLELPLTRDGRHCDFVPATLLAYAKASTGPGWGDRLTKWVDGRRRS